MAMTKAIQSGKEHRKPYRGSKAVDRMCRNHGGCMWCYCNRTYKYQKKMEKMMDEMKEWEAYV